MSKINPKRDAIGLAIFIILFGILLILSIFSYFNSKSILEIGLPTHVTNAMIIFLSLVGLIRTLWHIHHF